MHDQETQRKFVQLRAQGRSFARIATELNVARRTRRAFWSAVA